jgi:hypothetical protein
MIRDKTDPLQDRAAIRVEIRRLQHIEAKADASIRGAIVRRIQKLQGRLCGAESSFPGEVSAGAQNDSVSFPYQQSEVRQLP